MLHFAVPWVPHKTDHTPTVNWNSEERGKKTMFTQNEKCAFWLLSRSSSIHKKICSWKAKRKKKKKGKQEGPITIGASSDSSGTIPKEESEITPLRGERKQQNTDTLQFTADVAKTMLAGSAAVEEIFDMFVSHELIQHFFYSRLPTMPGWKTSFTQGKQLKPKNKD